MFLELVYSRRNRAAFFVVETSTGTGFDLFGGGNTCQYEVANCCGLVFSSINWQCILVCCRRLSAPRGVKVFQGTIRLRGILVAL